MKLPDFNNLNLPAFMPMKETFNKNPFIDTSEGSYLINMVSSRERIATLIKYATIVLTVIFAIYNYLSVSSGKILQAVVAAAIMYGIGSLAKYLYTRFMISPIKEKYSKKRAEYAWEIGNEMMNFYGGFLWDFGNGYFFLFNPDLCLYVDTERGEWVGYDKPSIKEVQPNHVHIGSSTVSKTSSSGVGIAWTNSVGSYHGSSTTHSETTSHYEWRLDILTGFVHYANLTLVFPDNHDGEDYVKKVKALLG